MYGICRTCPCASAKLIYRRTSVIRCAPQRSAVRVTPVSFVHTPWSQNHVARRRDFVLLCAGRESNMGTKTGFTYMAFINESSWMATPNPQRPMNLTFQSSCRRSRCAGMHRSAKFESRGLIVRGALCEYGVSHSTNRA